MSISKVSQGFIPSNKYRKRNSKLKIILKNYQIYLMLLPCILFFAIFCYGPMYGVQIAFKDYSTGLGIWGSPWVGFKHFGRFMKLPQFWNVFKNTITLSIYSLSLR